MNKTDHPFYHTWASMKKRCNNPNYHAYKNYGGRGIKVCEEWQSDFWQFVEDMGERPRGYTLEREDNDKGYSPDNCIWASRKAQIKNRRPRSRPKNAKGYSLTDSGNYEARATINGKLKHLGTYKCPLMAHLAYLDFIEDNS